ncbi:flagellar protein FlgN [Bacillus carboniphilus]|uniref:Flagellar protein FlgN n=1 Tax=Bacillus carboniphilus TaxID=86663 RepID=A0ABY9JSU0_9BACI|nr:flagellar protein FlgN [Bacillus carboniphilus]WLR41490.1 flagellar protein FlgN [Bacillus carboniphilus]
MNSTKLLTSLQSLLDQHLQLIELGKQKTTHLRNGNMDELRTLLIEEQRMMKLITQTEKQRIEHTSQFLGEDDHLTISACIERLSGEEKCSFENMREQLESVMEQLIFINDLNKQLLKQGLQFASSTLNFILPKEESFNYGKNNKFNSSERTVLFDSKI